MPGLRELVHELYELSDENRRFLHGRLLTDASGHALNDAIGALRRIISVQSVFQNRFRHSDAKRIVDQFAKATDDDEAVAQLLLADLEISFATFDEAGDFEPIVDHLYASLIRLNKIFGELSLSAVAPLNERATAMANRWGNQFGYGISDELTAFAHQWRERTARAGDGAQRPSPSVEPQ
jgi:hypothetical protein